MAVPSPPKIKLPNFITVISVETIPEKDGGLTVRYNFKYKKYHPGYWLAIAKALARIVHEKICKDFQICKKS